MNDVVDSARPVRQGEELDVGRLGAHLRQHVPELSDVDEFTVQQFPGGHSNLTYLLIAGGREYVLRRPPFGSKVKSAHDMGREYRILSRLHAVYPKAPEPLVFCEDPDVMGADFYVMRRLRGIILRKEVPPDVGLGESDLRKVQENLVDALVELHGLDYEAAGLGDLGKPKGYVERQVTGWTKRYHGSQTDEIPAMNQVASWLAENMPGEAAASLIHNDFKLDNVVLDPVEPTKIIGVLDWEMSTIGDPLMDLGTTLAYWVEPGDGALESLRWGPTTLPGSLTRQEVLDRYAQKSGRRVDDGVFYYAFGLFKTAVIIQQIYYRYKQGLTQDPRFAAFIMGVHVLCNHAARSIDSGKL
jgi:aminoglycoside phosphotransferase (APT) family kinase protein